MQIPGLEEPVAPVAADHILVSIVWAAGLMSALLFNRLYDEDTLFPGGGEEARILRSCLEAIAILSLFVFLTQQFTISRAWFLFMAVLSLTCLLFERRAVKALVRKRRRRGRSRRPVVAVTRDPAQMAEPGFEKEAEFYVVDTVAPEVLPQILADHLARKTPAPYPKGTIILLQPGDFSPDELWKIVVAAGESGLTVFVHAASRSMSRDRLTVREVGGHTLVKIAPPVLDGFRAAQKRALDLVLAGVGLVLVSPVMLLIGVVVAITSGLPVFYVQERVGRNGRPFRMYKFRTMVADAEDITGPTWTQRDDERRTTTGRFLRRLSLDELPQLWNVLKGDMSLVGPRPEQPHFVESFSGELGWYANRHRIRPGITGWAQAQGLRGQTSLPSRVEADNWYIEHWSLGLDVSILVRTLARMWSDREAY